MTEESVPGRPDQIFIRDLVARCTIGVNEQERQERQNVIVHITMDTDLGPAGHSDALADTIDYKALKKRILHLAENSRFRLIEALAQAVADECLKEGRIEQVEVTVEKPGALRFARTVGVRIVRGRGPASSRARGPGQPAKPL